jgi:hypothetical protein
MSELFPSSGTASRHLLANQFFPQSKQKKFQRAEIKSLKARQIRDNICRSSFFTPAL